jgi:hypothetical protein
MKSLNITLATVGSRGDVQPMIALARTLMERGHMITIAAPPDFGDWIISEGFFFSPLGDDMKQYLYDNPAALGGSAAEMYRTGKAFFSVLPFRAPTLSPGRGWPLLPQQWPTA